MNIRVHIVVSGKVQGVFFRSSTAEKAISLNLTGWVRNLPEGTVEIVAEGDEKKMSDFIDWCNNGPSAAKVQNVSCRFLEYEKEFTVFNVRA